MTREYGTLLERFARILHFIGDPKQVDANQIIICNVKPCAFAQQNHTDSINHQDNMTFRINFLHVEVMKQHSL